MALLPSMPQWLPRPHTLHPALGVQVSAPRLGLALQPLGALAPPKGPGAQPPC